MPGTGILSAVVDDRIKNSLIVHPSVLTWTSCQDMKKAFDKHSYIIPELYHRVLLISSFPMSQLHTSLGFETDDPNALQLPLNDTCMENICQLVVQPPRNDCLLPMGLHIFCFLKLSLIRSHTYSCSPSIQVVTKVC